MILVTIFVCPKCLVSVFCRLLGDWGLEPRLRVSAVIAIWTTVIMIKIVKFFYASFSVGYVGLVE